jgi:3-oxoacyl-[acyl-carrier-protein] synthase-3
MQAFIKAISVYFPETIVTNEDLAEMYPDWKNLKKSSKLTGVYSRYKTQEDECTSDITIGAANQLFKEHNIDKGIIDFVLLCTQSEDYFLPATACIIQDKLGLNTTCGALDVKMGCSGYVYGLSLAKGLIAGGIAQNVLLLTGDVVSKLVHPMDKANTALFSDAASATLVSTDGFAEIGNFSLGTDGSGAENLIIKSHAFRQLSPVNDLHFDDLGNPVSSDNFYMNGTEVFNFTVEWVPKLVKDTLTKNNMNQSDIHLFVFHQANKFILDTLREMMKIDKDKFYYYLSEVGNTSVSSVPIALYHAQKENLVKGNILLAGYGVGYSWAGCVLRTKE